MEKARRRERAEAEKRREQKPIKKRQSVAPVDAETLLKKAAAKVRTPAQPQRRGFSFSSWQTSNKRGAPAESDGEAQSPGAARTGVAAGLRRGAVQVQEGPHERRPARGDARGRGLIRSLRQPDACTHIEFLFPPARQLMAQPATAGRSRELAQKHGLPAKRTRGSIVDETVVCMGSSDTLA